MGLLQKGTVALEDFLQRMSSHSWRTSLWRMCQCHLGGQFGLAGRLRVMESLQSMDSGQVDGLALIVAGVVEETTIRDDEGIHEVTEDKLRESQKVNSIQCIELMRISTKEDSRFHIPLNRLVSMPLVRPILQSDVKRLEAEFTHRYRSGANVFYLSVCKYNGEEKMVTPDDIQRWGPFGGKRIRFSRPSIWLIPICLTFRVECVFICDGNHRFKAWTAYIDRLHKDDREWHFQ